MKLIHSFGMNPRLTRMFLIEKGINDIELVGVDILAGENRREPYLSRNPAGQTPLLELDDGTPIAETGAICEYLEERYPARPLIGTNAEERAATRMWWRRVEIGICHPMVFGFYYKEAYELFKDRVYCIPEAAEGLKERARVGMRWLDRQLVPGEFLAGERFTVADICLYTYIDQLRTVGQPIPEECGSLREWFDIVNARPSAEASVWQELIMGMRG
jgi:glutathione S-transferase